MHHFSNRDPTSAPGEVWRDWALSTSLVLLCRALAGLGTPKKYYSFKFCPFVAHKRVHSDSSCWAQQQRTVLGQHSQHCQSRRPKSGGPEALKSQFKSLYCHLLALRGFHWQKAKKGLWGKRKEALDDPIHNRRDLTDQLAPPTHLPNGESVAPRGAGARLCLALIS